MSITLVYMCAGYLEPSLLDVKEAVVAMCVFIFIID